MQNEKIVVKHSLRLKLWIKSKRCLDKNLWKSLFFQLDFYSLRPQERYKRKLETKINYLELDSAKRFCAI
jgi:hypothetical protein